MATVGGGVVGCVQLSALQVEAASDGPAWVGEGTMPTPIGAVLISRLAADRAWQRRGVAGVLEWHALVLAAAIAVGTRARLLVARSDGDLQFGVRLGFRPLAGHPGGAFCRSRTRRPPSPPLGWADRSPSRLDGDTRSSAER